MSTLAILPVKQLGRAKQRLADELSVDARRMLMTAMVTDVLICLRRASEVDQVLVVTRDDAVKAMANAHDAEAVVDEDERSHSEAALAGIREAVARGARRVLLVSGDCPTVDPQQLDALLRRTLVSEGPAVVVVPDRHGGGTNALVLTPPDVIAPSFGDSSRERHVRAALAAGARLTVDEVSSLLLDVDTAKDLALVRVDLSGRRDKATHTRAALDQLDHAG